MSARDGHLSTIGLPPGLTETQFVDSLLEMARLCLAQEPLDIGQALQMIAAARARLAAVRREGAAT
jgi:hypothetical protein